MSYQNAKVYSDGSHHIAILPQSNTQRKSEKKSKVSTVEEIELYGNCLPIVTSLHDFDLSLNKIHTVVHSRVFGSIP